METILSEKSDPAILKSFEHKYQQEEAMGNISPTTKFEYAWCLVRSPYSDDWESGYKHLRELYDIGDDHAKRDYLYYMAVAKFKLQQYEEALKYCEGILIVQPGNHQVLELKRYIQVELTKKGAVGMAVVGGATLVGGLAMAAAAALLLFKKR